MHPHLHFTKFLTVSLALHALVIAALFLIKPSLSETPLITPVTIVNLPQPETRQLPPLNRPMPVPPAASCPSLTARSRALCSRKTSSARRCAHAKEVRNKR